MAEGWSNWSGGVEAHPSRVATPRSPQEVCELVRRAAARGATVRTTGSGHSFVPLCATNDLLLSLDSLGGVLSADTETRRATIGAGTKLWQLGEPLRAVGLAMETMGDIDRQSLAGAISTGTHGTGRGLRSISNQVDGLRIATAPAGDVVDLDAATDLSALQAAQVSLGALGVVTEIRLRLLPTYRLHERTWTVDAETALEQLTELVAKHRHFEFFWTSKRDTCWMKALDPTDAAPDELTDLEGERIGHSDVILPTERNQKFNEIEFSLAAEDGPACFREIRELMLRRYPEVVWPLEYRTLAADDLPLSSAYGRPTVTISAHEAAERDYRPFFDDVETIFRSFGARPHWGKIHTHTAAELEPMYPRWADFQQLRETMDPHRTFTNDHLRRVLGD